MEELLDGLVAPARAEARRASDGAAGRRPSAGRHAAHRLRQREGRHLQDHALREHGAWIAGSAGAGAGRRPRHAGARRQGAGRGRARLSPTIRDVLVGESLSVRAWRAHRGARARPAPRQQGPGRLPGGGGRLPDRADRLRRGSTTCPGPGTRCSSTRRPRCRWSPRTCCAPPTEVVLPVALTYLALDGCAEILASLDALRAETRPRARASRWWCPRSTGRPSSPARSWTSCASASPGRSARTVLGFSVKIDEAQSHGRTIFEYAPRSPGARRWRIAARSCATGCCPRPPGTPRRAAPAAQPASTVLRQVLEPLLELVEPLRDLRELALHVRELEHALDRGADPLVDAGAGTGRRPPGRRPRGPWRGRWSAGRAG